MTMLPMYKKCRVCGKTYNWNPDVGRMNCPYCAIRRTGKLAQSFWHVLRKQR